ncbi:MAG: Do family serine endopeptidase [Bryobacteraceae bacterium]
MSFLDTVRRQKLLSFTLILFTLAAGILVGTLLDTGVKAAKEQTAPGAKPLVIPTAVEMQNSFAQLAKQLEPAVVHIAVSSDPKPAASARQRQQPRGRQMPQDEEEMNEFFYRFFGFGNPNSEGQRPQRRGLGSGVIVDPSGYILTNNHVVEKADRIQVSLYEGKERFDAKLIGTDADTDLAVIKIDAKRPLPAAKIGNSDGMQVGDWAVAIGSPFGLQATVTAGIISARERTIEGGSNGGLFQRFLQTDAAINPGNSGGPLINIRGEVIGINTAIASGTGGYQGIGFALPVNTAVKVYNQIIKSGKVTRGAIGVGFQEAQPELLKVYGVDQGVVVRSVNPGGPSDKAGLKPGDFITSVDGKPVKSGQDLVNIVSDKTVGSVASVSVIREGKKQDFQVTVGDRAAIVNGERSLEAPESGSEEEKIPAKFGVTIKALPAEQKSELGLNVKGGVLVQEVTPGSFADDIGIAPNDVILSINRKEVASTDDVRKIQSTLKPGDPVAFQVLRSAAGPLGRGRGEWTNLFLAGTLKETQ